MATVKKIGTELNWEVQKRAIYGDYKGYSVSLIQNFSYTNQQDNFKMLYIPYSNLDRSKEEELVAFINTNKKSLRILMFDLDHGIFSARLTEGFKGINALILSKIMNIIIEGFTRVDVTPKNTCAVCGLDNYDSIIYMDKIKLPAHESCKSKVISDNEQLEGIKEPFSLKGYLGAIIGAVIGAIPYAVAVWFGWYIGLLTFLTGFACYEGFKRTGGKLQKPTKFIVGLIAFIAILLSNVGLMGVIALQYSATIADVLSVPEIFSIFMESLGMSALFGILGIAAVFSRIRRDERQIPTIE